MNVSIKQTLITSKNTGKKTILEEEQYEFCEDLWRHIKEFLLVEPKRFKMEKVLTVIERMGCYDPLIIKLDKRFFKMEGYGTWCVGGIKLDKNIFDEGRARQHPKLTTLFSIKPVSCKIKHAQFETY